jgi:putative Mn2+ efflux pump MntP
MLLEISVYTLILLTLTFIIGKLEIDFFIKKAKIRGGMYLYLF